LAYPWPAIGAGSPDGADVDAFTTLPPVTAVCPPPMQDVRRRPDTRAATGSRKRTRHFYAFVAPRTSVS
jgi:hypothetical protein